LTEKVPRRLLPHASLDRLRASAALDTILLDDGEELLLFIDTLLGDGSGRVLEALGQELASRALTQGGVAKFGDLQGTVARLQAFLDHPFVDTPTLFELKRTDLGFTLMVSVVGRPRATRVLRHLSVGAIQAAERAAREGMGIKLSAELVADRAILNVRYQRSDAPPPPAPREETEPPPTSARRATTSMRPPSLSEEVERILGSRNAPGFGRKISPLRRPATRSSNPPPAAPVERTSEVQEIAPRVGPLERTSEVQPVAPRSGPDSGGGARPGELKRSKG
jgi:hypothetical protein